MIKNVIIGVLVVLSILLFFYGIVQQIEGKKNSDRLLEVEQKLEKAVKQSELGKQAADMGRKEMLIELEKVKNEKKILEIELEKLKKKN